jgi:PPM family protein phosphatase
VDAVESRETRQVVDFGCAATYDVGLCTDVGNERANNEDYVGYSYTELQSLVMAVADGVGGMEGGELASAAAVKVVLDTYREQPTTVSPDKRLYRAAQQANIEIYDRAIVVTELRGMSTTLTAIALEGAMLYAAHVGDSRLYLLRDGGINQLTKDHTVVAERLRQRTLSQEKALSHPDRGTLTRSLGRELIAAVDRIAIPVCAGDIVVLCTDGLYNALTDSQIADAAREPTAEAMSHRLVEGANQQGTYDNLSALVCRVVGELPLPELARSWPQRLRDWLAQ